MPTRTLIIAEKPSVARDIARVLGVTKKGHGFVENDNYVVSWCFGHLAGIAPDPGHYRDDWSTWSLDTLPILPERCEVVRTGDARQLGVLTGFLTDPGIDRVVNACDAAREGEAIFRNVYELAGSTKRVSRLWIASMTDQAIQAGLSNLQPGSNYDALADAARSREEADWFIGINATRAMTLKARAVGSQALFSVGRVQTPTLGLIVARDRAIESFVSQPFWRVYAHLSKTGTPFEAVCVDEQSNEKSWTDLGAARQLHVSLQQQSSAVVRSLDETERTTQAPLLYSLTALQREANARHGFSAAHTLELAQSLYETHKLLTYPRTDSAYITDDMEDSLAARLQACSAGSWAPCVALAQQAGGISARVVNNDRVADHHAIIPTEKSVDLAALSKDEAVLYELVARRFLANYFPPQRTLHQTVGLTLGPESFLAKGSRQLDAGWHVVEPPSDPSKDSLLPPLELNDTLAIEQLELRESKTRPPKRFTEASLLRAMETAGKELDDDDAVQAMKDSGLGTPATRAATIELLVARDYIGREGKSLVSTEIGRELIDAIPEPTLTSAELTGQWEAALHQVQMGALSREVFMQKVRELTSAICARIIASNYDFAASRPDRLGACPVCSTDVLETQKVYTCQTGRDCSFVIWKTFSKKRITPSVVTTLLNDRGTQELKGFVSKKSGKKFSARLVLTDEGRLAFDFGNEARKEA